MAHHCKYFIVHCMDFRLQEDIIEHLKKNGWFGDCDIVSIAGGIKDVDYVLGQLDISVRLHNSQEAVLINHIDCGAYGGSKAFNSFDSEQEMHAGEMGKIKAAIKEKYPFFNVKIELALLNEAGDRVSSFEEIKA